MDHPVGGKHSAGSNSVSAPATCAGGLGCLMMVAAALLVLLPACPGHGWPFHFGYHVEQIKSPVNYDPDLTDSFFQTARVGTAKCFSSIDSEHAIRFCNAESDNDGTIQIWIRDDDVSLRFVVKNGAFSCEYIDFSNVYPEPRSELWRTKKQELTLDKQVYHRGDVIKGRIYFECVDEKVTPELAAKLGLWPHPITVKGVFKTIVKSSLFISPLQEDR
jgi:hypothetical protein